MNAAEKAARTKKKRQANVAKALASPNHPRNRKAAGRPVKCDPDSLDIVNLKKKIVRKRLKRVVQGEFDCVDWDSVDQRHFRCKEVKRIVAKLLKEVDVTSYPKQLLAERCAFIIALIRNEETMALKGESFDEAKYIKLVGRLQTILATLGIENTNATKEMGLAAHLAKKSKNGKPK